MQSSLLYNFQTLLSPQRTTPSPLAVTPLHQVLAPTNPCPVSVNLPVLDVSHQWNHNCVLLLCLFLSLSIVSPGSIHVVVSVRASLLLMPESMTCRCPGHCPRIYCSSLTGFTGQMALLSLPSMNSKIFPLGELAKSPEGLPSARQSHMHE